MAYGKRSYRPRRKTGIRSIRPRKTAITKLATAVRRLQLKQRSDKSSYQLGFSVTQAVAQDYNYISLSNPFAYSSIFSTSNKTEDFAVSKTKHISTGIDMTVDHSVAGFDETGNVQYTCFLVSLKDQIGSAFNPSTGAITLIPNQHYHKTEGMVLLNKSCFNIHAIKRFNLGNNGEDLAFDSSNPYGTMKRWYMKVAPRCLVENPVGSIYDMQSANDPSKTYYLILFNNNSILDGQFPDWKINMVSTYRH